MTKIISIVTPCMNEEASLQDCYESVKRIFEIDLPGYAREHVFCDNASSDGTESILRELASRDECVKVIFNARNFGPARSMFNGVLSTTGDAVLLFLPADMQDPPKLLPEFVKRWEEGNEIVYGIRARRQESLIMRGVRRLYYRIISRLSEITIPSDVGDFQLVDRRVVEALRQFGDDYPYLRGMTFLCSSRSVGIPYEWKAREKGKSKNRLSSLLDQGLNGLISTSSVPVRLALFGGTLMALAAIVYAIVTLVISLILYPGAAPPGIPTLIVAIFFFAGVQLFFIGLLGEYVLAIHSQVRRRPRVIERERINFKDQD